MKKSYADSPLLDRTGKREHAYQPSGLIAEFLRDYRQAPPSTLHWFSRELGIYFLRYLELRGVDDLRHVDAPFIRDYLAHEAARGLAKKTLEHRYTSTHRLWQWMVEQGYLRENVVHRVRRPSVPEQKRTGYSRDEIARMLQFVCTDRNRRNWLGLRDRAILLTLLGTGARADELLGMTVDDVDFKRGPEGGRASGGGRILLHGKNQRDRFMPMGRNLAASLREWLDARPRVSVDDLWINLFGEPLTYVALRQVFRRLEEYSGVPNIEAHRFRHTYACEFYLANRDLLATQHALDHRQPATTIRYLRGLGVEFHLQARNPTPDDWLTG